MKVIPEKSVTKLDEEGELRKRQTGKNMSRHRIASGYKKIVLLYWDFERNAYTCWRRLDALLKDSCCAMKVIQ